MSTSTATATAMQNPSQTTSEKKQKSKPKSFFFSIQPQDQIDSQISKMSSTATSSSTTSKTQPPQPKPKSLFFSIQPQDQIDSQISKMSSTETSSTTSKTQPPQPKPYAPSLYAESTISTSTTKPLLRTTSNSSNSKRKTTGFRHKTKKFLSSLGEPPTAAWEREQALARADALAASEQGMEGLDEETKRERRIEEQRRIQLAFAMDYGPMSRGGPWNGRSNFT